MSLVLTTETVSHRGGIVPGLSTAVYKMRHSVGHEVTQLQSLFIVCIEYILCEHEAGVGYAK